MDFSGNRCWTVIPIQCTKQVFQTHPDFLETPVVPQIDVHLKRIRQARSQEVVRSWTA